MKRSFYVSHTYYDDCLTKLYPQTLDITDIKKQKVSGKRLAPFAYQLQLLLDSIKPSQLHEDPSTGTIDKFYQWFTTYGTGITARKTVTKKLVALGTNQKLLDTMERDKTPARLAMFNAYNLALHKGNKMVQFWTFNDQLNSLLAFGVSEDISQCGMLSLPQAIEYCTNKLSCAPSKKALLSITGFSGCIDNLQTEIDNVARLEPRYKKLRELTTVRKHLAMCHYLELRRVMGVDPEHVLTLPNTTIITNMDQIKSGNKRYAFMLLRAEFELQGRPDMIKYIEHNLQWCYTGIKASDRFTCISPWHNDVYDKVFDAYMLASKTRTSYIAQYKTNVGQEIGTGLMFVYNNTLEKYAEELDGIYDPFKWFVDNCDLSMIKYMIIDYVRTRAVNNDVVKSTNDCHHGQKAAKRMKRLFSLGLAEIIECDGMSTISVSSLLRRVENKRVAADPMTRREFTDDEMESMMNMCADDPKISLLLTILREIGLRVSSISHMKYYMLADESHMPRDVCNIPEKRKSYRQFVTSFAMKKKIKVYCDYVRAIVDTKDLENIYIFNLNNRTQPWQASEIRKILTQLAVGCNVTDVHVHPHAFRHTIVGKLIQVGNSMEVVSKFMGHKSVDVTMKHYWVANIKDLTNNMVNPFTGSLQDAQMKAETGNLELELMYAKKKKCMEIIYVYNKIISECVDKSGSAVDIQRAIFEQMPDLGSVLKDINESVSGSISGTSAITDHEAIQDTLDTESQSDTDNDFSEDS
jgi:integrase